MTESFSQE